MTAADFAAWDARSTATLTAAIATTHAHADAERAIAAGEWPFVCPYCGGKFQTEDGHFPYCGAICAINASFPYCGAICAINASGDR